MAKRALGILETVGLTAAIEAADTAVKSSNVTLLGYELSNGGGMVTIRFEGDVGAVKAALEAASAAAGRVSKVYSKLMIPRPHDELEKILYSKEVVGLVRPELEVSQEVSPQESEPEEPEESEPEESKPEVSQPEETEPEETEPEESAAPKDSEAEEEDVEMESMGALQAADSEENDELVFEELELEQEETDAVNQSEEVCNLCFDPKCPRKKGDLRTTCIHYKEARRHH